MRHAYGMPSSRPSSSSLVAAAESEGAVQIGQMHTHTHTRFYPVAHIHTHNALA